MASAGKRWYHVTVGTLNSWLPGDPRGFRSKGHRIHSSGDHLHPPPPGEHANLHRYMEARSGPPIILPGELRPGIGQTYVSHLAKLGHRLLAASVSGMHVHLLAELPSDEPAAKTAMGRAKRLASLRVNHVLPGRVWERDMGLKPINDLDHHREVYRYILGHAEEGAWTWCLGDNTGGSPNRGGMRNPAEP